MRKQFISGAISKPILGAILTAVLSVGFIPNGALANPLEAFGGAGESQATGQDLDGMQIQEQETSEVQSLGGLGLDAPTQTTGQDLDGMQVTEQEGSGVQSLADFAAGQSAETGIVQQIGSAGPVAPSVVSEGEAYRVESQSGSFIVQNQTLSDGSYRQIVQAEDGRTYEQVQLPNGQLSRTSRDSEGVIGSSNISEAQATWATGAPTPTSDTSLTATTQPSFPIIPTQAQTVASNVGVAEDGQINSNYFQDYTATVPSGSGTATTPDTFLSGSPDAIAAANNADGGTAVNTITRADGDYTVENTVLTNGDLQQVTTAPDGTVTTVTRDPGSGDMTTVITDPLGTTTTITDTAAGRSINGGPVIANTNAPITPVVGDTGPVGTQTGTVAAADGSLVTGTVLDSVTQPDGSVISTIAAPDGSTITGTLTGSLTSGQTLGALMTNTFNSSDSIPGLFSGISYLLGIILGFMAIIKLKEHVESPNQVPIWEPVKRFLAGGMFLALPFIMVAVQQTIQGTATGVTLTGSDFNTGGVSGTGLDAMLVRLMADIWQPVQYLLLGFCYLSGIILTMIGISRLLKSEQDGPRGPMGLGTVMTFLVAGILFSVDHLLAAANNSIFGESARNYAAVTYAAAGAEAGHANAVIGGILAFVAVIGLISFIRGFFILRKVAEGDGQASMMAAVTHVLGGAIAVNLGGFIHTVQNTLGITGFGLTLN